jgi:hypothetical protein
LLVAAKTTPFYTLAMTWMRLGEGLALMWNCVGLAARVIHIRRGFTDGRIEPTTSGGTREVDMAAFLAGLLPSLPRTSTTSS